MWKPRGGRARRRPANEFPFPSIHDEIKAFSVPERSSKTNVGASTKRAAISDSSSATKRRRKKWADIPTRTKVGWIAIGMGVLILIGVITGEASLFEFNRMGIVMFLLWLAWPELEALPRWALFVVPISVVACAWRPQFLVVVLPLSFIYLLLRPSTRPAQKRKNAPPKIFQRLSKKFTGKKKQS